MHTHISAVHAVFGFLVIVLVGTLWRLAAAHMVASSSPTANRYGQAMAVQY